jgi:ribosome recycling factor
VTIEEARTLRISPWDKSVIKDIERAIRDSGMPLSVMADSDGLRATVPQLTAESKLTLVKLCKEKLEEARVKVRLERQQVDRDISETEKAEDDAFRAKEELQKLVESTNNSLESLFDKKEIDITAV